MIIDKELELSDGQAITADAISENVIDTGALPVTKDIGLGAQMYLVCQIDADFDLLTTLEITIESDSTANLATTPVVHYSSGLIALATLLAGYQFIIPLPPADYQRYVGARYDVVGTNPGAGAISLFFTPDAQKNVIYPDAL